jgi:uncharacterized protein
MFGTLALALALLAAPSTSWAGRAERPRPVPDGFVVAEVRAVLPVPGGALVLLTDPSEERLLQIAVGGSEGLTIALRHRREAFVRPLTHDLLDSLLVRAKGRVVEVRVDDLVDETFVAKVTLRVGRKEHVIDGRASDAIALALGRDLPILVADRVMAEAGFDPSDLTLPGGGETL